MCNFLTSNVIHSYSISAEDEMPFHLESLTDDEILVTTQKQAQITKRVRCHLSCRSVYHAVYN